MTKTRTCKTCRAIYEGEVCPKCGGSSFGDTFKGRVVVVDPEKSEIAKQIGISKEGTYAIKL